MQLTTFLSTLLAATAIAVPTTGGDKGYIACTPGSLYINPQCCATDVLGVADLDCHNPTKFPTSAKDFQSTCAAVGQRARCCVLPVLGQAVLCQTPIGGT